MKQKAILVFFLFCSLGASAQKFPDFKKIKLNKNAQFIAAEPAVTQIVAILFSTPLNQNIRGRRNAGEFLVRWMNGTKEHIFFIDDTETRYFDTNADLLMMYMASLTKYTLENPAIKDKKPMTLGAMQLLLPYLYAQNNKKQWSAALWQLYDANVNGKLMSFLYP